MLRNLREVVQVAVVRSSIRTIELIKPGLHLNTGFTITIAAQVIQPSVIILIVLILVIEHMVRQSGYSEIGNYAASASSVGG